MMHLQEIFLAAIEMEDLQQRAAYLLQVCGQDQALHRKVTALLAAHDRSGDFLDVPVLQQMAGGKAQARKEGRQNASRAEIDLSFLQPSSKPDSLGRLLHYEVLEVIGRGGCGVVMKAFDEKLHRVVAIKTMLPQLAATSPARKRFLREARATAAIRHENVVAIYAVEEKPLPFLVMEYIDGPTLQDKILQIGPLDLQDVISIGWQVAQGLEAAHARGLIHRDIKPANILLENGTDRPRITDFGLARSADDASLTQSGAISGTPLYMSPEQAQGLEVDLRSDLFSLGSVLYVMCSGRPPFRASTAIAVLKRVVDEQPRPIQEIIPEVPLWLVSLIAKLHAKQPTERFTSAKEVSNLLGQREAAHASKTSPRSLNRKAGAPGNVNISSSDTRNLWPRVLFLDIVKCRSMIHRWWLVATATVFVFFVLLSAWLLLRKPAGNDQIAVQNSHSSANVPANAVVGNEVAAYFANSISPVEQEEEGSFVPMFNGKDLTGWQQNNSGTIKWTINGQVVRGANSGYHPSKGGELYSTRMNYRDFHFRCEILAGQRGNPGVLFRQNRTLQNGVRRGYRIPNPSIEKMSRNDPWGIGSLHEEVFQVGLTPVSPAIVPTPEIRAGEWYKLEIIARGEMIRVLVNGTVTTEYQDSDPPARTGAIGFSCPILSNIAVRNVEIMELKMARDPLASLRRTANDPGDPIVGTWRMHMGPWPHTGELYPNGTGEGRFHPDVLIAIRNKNNGSAPPETFPLKWEKTSNGTYSITGLEVTQNDIVLNGDRFGAPGWQNQAERLSTTPNHGPDPVVGKWAGFVGPHGLQATYEFRENGTGVMSVAPELLAVTNPAPAMKPEQVQELKRSLQSSAFNWEKKADGKYRFTFNTTGATFDGMSLIGDRLHFPEWDKPWVRQVQR